MSRIFFWLLTVFFIFIGQMLSTDFLSIYGVFPNVLLLATVFFSLQLGSMRGQWVGFILGLLADVASISILGSQTFMYTLIGNLVGRLHGQIDEEKPIAQMTLVFAASSLYFVGLLAFESFFTGSVVRFGSRATFFQPLYTTFMGPIVFWILSRWCLIQRNISLRQELF